MKKSIEEIKCISTAKMLTGSQQKEMKGGTGGTSIIVVIDDTQY